MQAKHASRRPIGTTLFFPRIVAALAIGAVCSSDVDAQHFQVLHSFSNLDSRGYEPADSALVQVGSQLFGTTLQGGAGGDGSVFSMNLDGSNFRFYEPPTSSSASGPQSLTLLGAKLYGVTDGGGPASQIFSVTPGLSDFQAVHAYSYGSSSLYPRYGLSPINGQLYGTTPFTTKSPPTGFSGEAFAVNADGTNYHVLHSFDISEGTPAGNLIQNGATIYGYTNNFLGEIYSMNADGSNFQVLHQFGGLHQGSDPHSLSLIGSTFFGTTRTGGTGATHSTIYTMNLDGSNYHLIYSFDGSGFVQPFSGLVLVGSQLYGTAQLSDGSTSYPFVYAINPDGSDYHVIHAFDSPSGGASPLIAIGNTLYGTTESGGDGGWGVAYSITVPEPSGLVLATFVALLLGCATLRGRR